MIHDQVSSVVSLAKSILFGLDRGQVQSSLPTAQLVLILETLIEIGLPKSNIGDSAHRSVLAAMTEINEGLNSQQDAWQKQAEAEAALVEQSARKNG